MDEYNPEDWGSSKQRRIQKGKGKRRTGQNSTVAGYCKRVRNKKIRATPPGKNLDTLLGRKNRDEKFGW